MLKRFWEHRRDEEGFTLIELMVVVLIIGILIAIALPTFLGARKRAQDRAAQSSLRDAIAAAKTLYTDNDQYVAAGGVALVAADFQAVEPSLTWDVDPSTAPKEIAWGVADVGASPNQEWFASAMSDSGACFYIDDVEVGAGAGTFYGSDPTGAACAGADAQGQVGAKW